MQAYLLILEGAVAQGLLWGIMALGVYLTFKILDFADLSVEGTFALGGAVSAILIKSGMNPFLTLIFAILAGLLAGLVTGFFNTVLKIPPILAGILTMIGLYSINIRVMKNSANISLFNDKRINTIIADLILPKNISVAVKPYMNNLSVIIVGVAAVILVIWLTYLFFGTEIGSSIRATGTNANMARALGVNTDGMKVLALMLSNALVGLSGAMVAQTQGAADVQSGQGSIVIGLAGIIIGEVIFCRKDHPFWYKLMAVVIGSVIYRIIYALTLKIGLKASDTKLITALIVAVALGVPVIKTRLAVKKARKENDKKYADAMGGNVNA